MKKILLFLGLAVVLTGMSPVMAAPGAPGQGGPGIQGGHGGLGGPGGQNITAGPGLRPGFRTPPPPRAAYRPHAGFTLYTGFPRRQFYCDRRLVWYDDFAYPYCRYYPPYSNVGFYVNF